MKEKSGIAGIIIFAGAVQFLLLLLAAESLYPNYSIANNAISDLGVGSTALLFNASVFAFGLIMAAAGFLVLKELKPRIFAILLMLSGFGAMGVGLFPETTGLVHVAAAFFAFFFGALAAIFSFKIIKNDFRFFGLALGAIAIVSLGFFLSGNFLGLGHGGMERMIAYPTLFWAIGFGSFLMAKETKNKKA